MKGRKLVQNTIHFKNTRSNAFWVGHPTDEAKQMYYEELGIRENELSELEMHNAQASVLLTKRGGTAEIAFNTAIGSDMTWISPELDMSCWKHPQGKPMWDCFEKTRTSLGSAGIFAECEDVAQVEAFDWPNVDYLDFSAPLSDLKYAYDEGLAVFGGMWCPFFHVVSDFFGMENYFVKMYTDPGVVHAVTEHVVDFYVETNKRFLEQASPYMAAGFFGNDLGTQLDLMVCPEAFDEFLLPYIKRIIGSIQNASLKVAMHSCGAIDRIIPRLLDAGVDILHPLQAKAQGMDAESLAAKYGGHVVFMGGVDTQQLLPFGTAQQVHDEVLRLRELFKGNFIVSPSHEALLPNVPFENVLAMSRAAKE